MWEGGAKTAKKDDGEDRGQSKSSVCSLIWKPLNTRWDTPGSRLHHPCAAWGCQLSGAHPLCVYPSPFLSPLLNECGIDMLSTLLLSSPRKQRHIFYMVFGKQHAVRKQVKWAHMLLSNETAVRLSITIIFYSTQIKRKQALQVGEINKTDSKLLWSISKCFYSYTVNKFMCHEVYKMHILSKVHLAKWL